MARNQRAAARERRWREQIGLWQSSGLSVRAFCAQHGLIETSFYYWKRELQARDAAASTASANSSSGKESRPTFIPLTVIMAFVACVLDKSLLDMASIRKRWFTYWDASRFVPYRRPPTKFLLRLSQFAFILSLGLLVVNLGYEVDGSLARLSGLTATTGTQLAEFQFVSTSMTGLEKLGTSGNRFSDTWFGSVSMPFPRQYVLGFDSQKKDFEKFQEPSYLRGEWREQGWWYYYIYGLLVKVPCGIWGLLMIVTGCRLLSRKGNTVGSRVLIYPTNARLAANRALRVRIELHRADSKSSKNFNTV